MPNSTYKVDWKIISIPTVVFMAFLPAHSDEPALNTFGHLRDASELEFYNSESDDVPLSRISKVATPRKWNPQYYTQKFLTKILTQALRRSTRASTNKLDVLLDAENTFLIVFLLTTKWIQKQLQYGRTVTVDGRTVCRTVSSKVGFSLLRYGYG